MDRRIQLLWKLAEAFGVRRPVRDKTYPKDPNPEHWKTINGSHVHMDKNGNYDGGAGGKFNGRHHYGPNWRQKAALMNRLTAALHKGIKPQKVAPKATNQGNNGGKSRNGAIINTGQEKKEKERQEKEKKLTSSIKASRSAMAKELNREKMAEEDYKKLADKYIQLLSAFPRTPYDVLKKCKDEREQAFLEWNKARLKADKISNTVQKQQEELEEVKFDSPENKRETVQFSGDELKSTIWQSITHSLDSIGVARKTIQKLPFKLTEEEIISRLSGGDLTKGSCSSLSYAYIANKMGLDVIDYRGGDSRYFFARGLNIWHINGLTATGGKKIFVRKEAPDCAKEIMKIKEGHEYRLVTGSHAAIIRKVNGKLQYLELQAPVYRYNGWKDFGSKKSEIVSKLAKRFGAKKTVPGSGVMSLIDIEEFKDNVEFYNLMEYINNDKSKQKKGNGGNVR